MRKISLPIMAILALFICFIICSFLDAQIFSDFTFHMDSINDGLTYIKFPKAYLTYETNWGREKVDTPYTMEAATVYSTSKLLVKTTEAGVYDVVVDGSIYQGYAHNLINNGGAYFNFLGINADFLVKALGQAYMFYINGTTGKIGILTNETSTYALNIDGNVNIGFGSKLYVDGIELAGTTFTGVLDEIADGTNYIKIKKSQMSVETGDSVIVTYTLEADSLSVENMNILDADIPAAICRDSELTGHSNTTTSVHGISDTDSLMTVENYDADRDGKVTYAETVSDGTNSKSAADIKNHIDSTGNPHSVTYSQAGAIQNSTDTVNDTHLDFGTGASQINLDDIPDNTYIKIKKSELSVETGDSVIVTYTLEADSLSVENMNIIDADIPAAICRDSELSGHTNLTNNPHSVTYTQVGAIQDAADTVKDTHLDFGTGANQVNLDDIPDNTYIKIPKAELSYETGSNIVTPRKLSVMTTDATYAANIEGDINIAYGSKYKIGGTDWNPAPSSLDVVPDGSTYIRVPKAYLTFETEAGTYTPAAWFNAGSANIDFRIQSDGNLYMFWLDAANDRISIGSNASIIHTGTDLFLAGESTTNTTLMDIYNASSNASITGIGSSLRLTNTGTYYSALNRYYGGVTSSWGGSNLNTKLTNSLVMLSEKKQIITAPDNYISSGTSSVTNCHISVLSNEATTSRPEVELNVDGTAEVTCRINEIIINEDSKDLDFRVESNGNANALFVDGGTDKIGIFTTETSTYQVNVEGTVNSAGFYKNGVEITGSGSFTGDLDDVPDGSNYIRVDKDIMSFEDGEVIIKNGADTIATIGEYGVTSSQNLLPDGGFEYIYNNDQDYVKGWLGKSITNGAWDNTTHSSLYAAVTAIGDDEKKSGLHSMELICNNGTSMVVNDQEIMIGSDSYYTISGWFSQETATTDFIYRIYTLNTGTQALSAESFRYDTGLDTYNSTMGAYRSEIIAGDTTGFVYASHSFYIPADISYIRVGFASVGNSSSCQMDDLCLVRGKNAGQFVGNQQANFNARDWMRFNLKNSGTGIFSFNSNSLDADFEIYSNTMKAFLIDGSGGGITIPGPFGMTSASGTTLYINSEGVLGTSTSLREAKSNIQSMSNTDWLYKLSPVTFNFRKENEDKTYSDEVYPDLEYGLIAEEVQSVKPEFTFADRDGKLRGVKYEKLIPVLLNEIQRLNKRIEALEAK